VGLQKILFLAGGGRELLNVIIPELGNCCTKLSRNFTKYSLKALHISLLSSSLWPFTFKKFMEDFLEFFILADYTLFKFFHNFLTEFTLEPN